MLFPRTGELFANFLLGKILVIKLDGDLGDKIVVEKEHYFYFDLAKPKMIVFQQPMVLVGLEFVNCLYPFWKELGYNSSIP